MFKVPGNPFETAADVSETLKKLATSCKADPSRQAIDSQGMSVLCDAIATLADEIETLKSQEK